jgi:hypothetical protein
VILLDVAPAIARAAQLDRNLLVRAAHCRGDAGPPPIRAD